MLGAKPFSAWLAREDSEASPKHTSVHMTAFLQILDGHVYGPLQLL